MTPDEMARRSAEVMLAADDASRALGIEIEIPAAGSALARMTVRKDMLNGHAVCHGGYIFTLADTAFAFACNTGNRVSVAASANIDFIRPARVGDELTAVAEEEHAGRHGGVYTVRIARGDGKTIAVFRGRSSATDPPIK